MEGMFAALPVLVAALTSASSVAISSSATTGTRPDDVAAAVVVADVLGRAERVTAIHELAGAVAFDFEGDGWRWQLTVALDDDGAVVDSALAALGRAAAEPRRAQAPPPMTRLTLARIDRIDLGAAGHLVLRGGRGAQVVTVAGA